MIEPRPPYYTSAEYAEFLGMPETRLRRHIDHGPLKESLYYEWPDGKGWFFEDHPGRTDYLSSCNSPPIEKYYIRLADAERFEREHFADAVLRNDAPTTDTESTPQQLRFASLEHDTAVAEIEIQILPTSEPVEEDVAGSKKQKGGRTEPITVLIRAFLGESYPDHNPTMFYEYLKKRRASEQAKGLVTKKGDKSTFPVDRLGKKPGLGVRMVESKRGYEGNDEAEFWYTHQDIA